jgi:uncharacterized protein YceK
MKKILSIIVVTCVVSGCAKINSTAISYRGADAQRLFVWKSNYSAGMGTNSGICAQGALTALASSTDLDAKLPNGKEITDFGVKQTQSIARINSSNNQTAFANISLFYLCQIVLNSRKKTTVDEKNSKGEVTKTTVVYEQGMDFDKIQNMWNASINATKDISKDSAGLDRIDSPSLNRSENKAVDDKSKEDGGSKIPIDSTAVTPDKPTVP